MPGNQLELQHPSGARVVLLGTTHVSGLHGCFVADAISALQPRCVVLEVDEDRYEQLKFRLAYLLHHDTASLMALTAGDGDDDAAQPPQASSRTLAALRWSQHKQQFCLMRNEGVPLLLGSLYGSDLLQAALAATLGLQQPATLVLADQEQELTLARFRLLADGLGPLRQLVAAAVAGIAGVARAEALPMPASEQLPQLAFGTPASSDNSSSSDGSSFSHHNNQHAEVASAGQLVPVLAAAAQLASWRIFHLFLQWWSMALSSQAEWYGQQVHPVFLLAESGSSSSSSSARQLQQQLVQRGVDGVAEAAAAAARLLDIAAAAAAASGGGSACSPAVAAEDVAAIRRCIESMERISWAQQSSGAAGGCSSGASGEPPAADDQQQQQQHLLPVRPWWVALSQGFSSAVGGSAAHAAVGGITGASGQQGQGHANFVAAAAYERAVMAERNAVLAQALWEQAAAAGGSGSAAARAAAAAAAAAAAGPDEDAPAVVVGVVGVNHLPGIALEWQQQWQQQQQQQHTLSLPGSPAAGSSGVPSPWTAAAAGAAQQPMLSHTQVAATDAAASVIELLAAGAAGLGFVSALNRGSGAPPAAAAAAGASSSGRFAGSSGHSSSSMRLLPRSPGLRRLGLLLLPVCVSLVPLQRDAGRMQEAAGLLSNIAAVNDEMMDGGRCGSGAAAMMQLVQQQQQM